MKSFPALYVFLMQGGGRDVRCNKIQMRELGGLDSVLACWQQLYNFGQITFDSLASVTSWSHESLGLLKPAATFNGAEVETEFRSPLPIGKCQGAGIWAQLNDLNINAGERGRIISSLHSFSQECPIIIWLIVFYFLRGLRPFTQWLKNETKGIWEEESMHI